MCTYHWASPAPPLQPLMLPGWHTCGLEFVPDHALLRAVIHFLQPPECFFILHVTAAGRHKTRREKENSFREEESLQDVPRLGLLRAHITITDRLFPTGRSAARKRHPEYLFAF